MKKLLLTTMLVTALAGCSSAKTSAASASGDHLARIQSAGKITIATEGVWSPLHIMMKQQMNLLDLM